MSISSDNTGGWYGISPPLPCSCNCEQARVMVGWMYSQLSTALAEIADMKQILKELEPYRQLLGGHNALQGKAEKVV